MVKTLEKYEFKNQEIAWIEIFVPHNRIETGHD
jgi:hypothetical protein